MGNNFFVWHYSRGLKKYLEIWRCFLEFFFYKFSVVRFLRTLFSAWKRDVTRVWERGFHPVLWFQAMWINIFTRFVGATLKLSIISAFIFFEAGVVILGFSGMLFWLFFPFGILLGAVGAAAAFLGGAREELSASLLVFLCSLMAGIFSWNLWKSKTDSYAGMGLLELSKEKWFWRVWSRLGKKKEEVDPEIITDLQKRSDFLKEADITEEEFEEVARQETARQIQKEKSGQFWRKENIFRGSPIGKNWLYAYTVFLDRYSNDLSEIDYSEYKNARLTGKENDLEQLELILSRGSQNSAVLVGEPGVGKSSIIHVLAGKIRNSQNSAYLNSKRVLELDLERVLADHPYPERDGALHRLFQEAAYAGNIILVINQAHNFLNPSNPSSDISSVIEEYLPLPNFQLIGTTDFSNFHSTVEKRAGFMKYCSRILVEEMDAKSALKSLWHKLEEIEKNQILITYQAIREIVRLSDRYITDAPFPEKALDMLEEVILYYSSNPQTSFITAQTVSEAVARKIKVPLGELNSGESQKLLNLEEILHQRIVGQNLAVSQIAQTVRRSRIGMSQKNKPLGSFLFLGPTGVGKTECAKALAESYFGEESRMVRLDMSEYQNPDSLDRLLGSSRLGKGGYLADKMKESPYGLLLLDEIEKAYPDILNVFLQVLDEGYFTDAEGKKINFRNTIIIATSNAASETIARGVEDGVSCEDLKKKVIESVVERGIFRAEFLNRFEGVIFFHPLSKEDIVKVTKMLLEKFRLSILEQESLKIEFGDSLAGQIAERSFDPVFGARAVNRFIQDKLEDNIAKNIIAGNLKKGDSLKLESLEDLAGS